MYINVAYVDDENPNVEDLTVPVKIKDPLKRSTNPRVTPLDFIPISAIITAVSDGVTVVIPIAAFP